MFRVTCPEHGVVVAKDAPMDVKRPEQDLLLAWRPKRGCGRPPAGRSA
jgi:hypothetical protein